MRGIRWSRLLAPGHSRYKPYIYIILNNGIIIVAYNIQLIKLDFGLIGSVIVNMWIIKNDTMKTIRYFKTPFQ